MVIWKIPRMGLWLAAFLMPLAGMAETGLRWLHLWVMAPLAWLVFFAWVFLVGAMTRVLDTLGSRSGHWSLPSIHARPFAEHSPLQFWWTLDIAFVAAGISACIGTVFHGAESLKYGSIWLCAGVGGLMGIRCCLRVFGAFRRVRDGAPVAAGRKICGGKSG